MDVEKKEEILKSVQKKLTFFFPEFAGMYTPQAIEDGIDDGEILIKARDLLPYLQSAFFDNKVFEVELDGMTWVYFSRVHDDLPDLVEEMVEGELVLREPDYTPGDYLKKMTHLICLPLESGMGNLKIRNSQRIILRFFTSTCAIEMGTVLQDLVVVRDLPVLRFEFPVIGRQVKGVRAYRAKMPEEGGFSLFIEGKHKRPSMTCRPIDISFLGMSFAVSKEEQKLFRVDETCRIRLFHDEEMKVQLNCTVRSIAKVRGHKGTEFTCALQFDLPTRSVASAVEDIVTMVQRNHLKELAEKSEELGISLIQ